jgi:hypothetical protein
MKHWPSSIVQYALSLMCALAWLVWCVAQDLPSGAQITPAVDVQLLDVLKQALLVGLSEKDVAQHYQ